MHSLFFSLHLAQKKRFQKVVVGGGVFEAFFCNETKKKKVFETTRESNSTLTLYLRLGSGRRGLGGLGRGRADLARGHRRRAVGRVDAERRDRGGDAARDDEGEDLEKVLLKSFFLEFVM